MQPPKILQVIPTLETGGAERTALDIGNAIINRGWESLVASGGGRMLEKLLAAGNEHIHLPLNSKNPITIWRNAGRLEKLIRQRDIDLIHARSRAPAWSALIAARRTGIPFVTTYHGAYNQKSRLKGWYNSVMARADVVIANSKWTAALIEERNPWALERIRVVQRGTDFDHFNATNISAERLADLRASWGVSKNQRVILKLARLTGWKGQMVIIQAAGKIAADYPNCRFILAGDSQGRDSYVAELKQAISELGLDEQVRLVGHCEDAAAAVCLADLVVVASTEAEAFGRAATEAGALETPVIVSDIGAVGETVLSEPAVSGDEITGWKVTPGDADELAAALRKALDLPDDKLAEIGRRARQHGTSNFSLQKMFDETLAIYDELLGLPVSK